MGSEIEVLRTPEERFASLPGYPYAPQYHVIGDVRLAYVDEGPRDAPPVWLLHGEPTWGFLWRKVLPPLLEAGHRVVVPDLAGFGRSDKPADLGWYSYDRHAELMGALVEHLDLRGATAVVHDWGGPIGMRVFTEHAERFERLVVLDTGLFTGEQKMSDAWFAFRDFVERTEDLPIGFLVKGAAAGGLEPEVEAAYEAPFPGARFKAGARAFPLMMPLTPQDPGAQAGIRVRQAMEADERPKLVLWADGDPILPVKTGQRLAQVIGAPEPELVGPASHFLQEDVGEQIGERIARWLAEPAAEAA